MIGTKLYGTGNSGGASGTGAIWSYDTVGSTYAVEHSFTAGTEGSAPVSTLLNIGGVLYGTTGTGGPSGGGTVFSYNPTGSVYTVLHSFGGVDDPTGGPLAYDGTYLYGTTYAGGTNAKGMAYSITPAGAGYSVLYNFGASGTDAANPAPYGGPVVIGGTIYGLSEKGGAFGGNGTLYSLAVPPPAVPEPATGLLALAAIAGGSGATKALRRFRRKEQPAAKA